MNGPTRPRRFCYSGKIRIKTTPRNANATMGTRFQSSLLFLSLFRPSALEMTCAFPIGPRHSDYEARIAKMEHQLRNGLRRDQRRSTQLLTAIENLTIFVANSFAAHEHRFEGLEKDVAVIKELLQDIKAGIDPWQVDPPTDREGIFFISDDEEEDSFLRPPLGSFLH